MSKIQDSESFENFDHREDDHMIGAECRWARMRALPKLPRSDNYGGFHVVTRHDDVEEVARNHEVYSSAQGISFPDLDFGTPLIPSEIDPPLHGEYRSLLARFFTRKYVEALAGSFREMARELLDRIGDERRVEFVDRFCRPFPVYVSLELLGLPRADAPLLDRLVVELHRHRGTDQGAEAAVLLRNYLEDKVREHAAKATDPTDSILSAVALGQVDGRRMTMEEQTSLLRLLMFGGFDTTSISLATAMWWLATHPEDAERLRRDPELYDGAIEEVVRYSAPGSYLRRTVTEETCLGGTALKPGDRVLISFLAANRDPAKFERPDEIVIDRKPNRHLGFGIGIHRCIGSFVAKVEMREALQEILSRYGAFHLDPERPIRWRSGENQGIAALPLILGPLQGA